MLFCYILCQKACKIWHRRRTKTGIRVHFSKLPMLTLPRYLQVETRMRASHVYHAVRQQLFEFYMFPHRCSMVFLSRFSNTFSAKSEVKNDTKSNKKHHFSSGVLFIATMGPLSTPKINQKGSILRPLAPQKGAKEPLWHPKRAQRSHCEGPGRLKWCPKAHLDGFGVPRCPQKLHLYATDAQNWPQGFHFERFWPQFVYSKVFFECVCVMFLRSQFSFDF